LFGVEIKVNTVSQYVFPRISKTHDGNEEVEPNGSIKINLLKNKRKKSFFETCQNLVLLIVHVEHASYSASKTDPGPMIKSEKSSSIDGLLGEKSRNPVRNEPTTITTVSLIVHPIVIGRSIVVGASQTPQLPEPTLLLFPKSLSEPLSLPFPLPLSKKVSNLAFSLTEPFNAHHFHCLSYPIQSSYCFRHHCRSLMGIPQANWSDQAPRAREHRRGGFQHMFQLFQEIFLP
jgi:hypothetical protein